MKVLRHVSIVLHSDFMIHIYHLIIWLVWPTTTIMSSLLGMHIELIICSQVLRWIPYKNEIICPCRYIGQCWPKKTNIFFNKLILRIVVFFLSLTWRTWGSRVAQVCVWCLRVWRYWILPGTSVDQSAPHPRRPLTESFRSSLAEEHRSGLALVTKREKSTVVKPRWSWKAQCTFMHPRLCEFYL